MKNLLQQKNVLPIVHRSEMLGELMRLKQSIAIAGLMVKLQQPP